MGFGDLMFLSLLDIIDTRTLIYYYHNIIGEWSFGPPLENRN